MSETTEARCTLPPPGWLCTRKPGHAGPCAAVDVCHMCLGTGKIEDEGGDETCDECDGSGIDAGGAWQRPAAPAVRGAESEDAAFLREVARSAAFAPTAERLYRIADTLAARSSSSPSTTGGEPPGAP
jgi:hypothetical protein